MITNKDKTLYSATDITRWLGCAHASKLDAFLQTDSELQAWMCAQKSATEDSGPEPAAARGDAHELAMLQTLIDSGMSVAEIPRPAYDDPDGLANAAEATRAAMEDGVAVVFQAALVDGPWFGYADFLVRVDGVPSVFGDYAYEVRDTKLARHPSASALIQMAHYGAILEELQQTPPPRLVIWLGTGEMFQWRYADAVPYLREAHKAFLEFHDNLPDTEPVPMSMCSGCRWLAHCDERWGPGDLRHIHQLSSRQRALLNADGIMTITDLAAAGDGERPDGVGVDTFTWLRDQAKVQSGESDWQTISPQPNRSGIFGTPMADPLDIYFDLEGDPFAATPTLDYLWAFCDVNGQYYHRWAHTPDAEREAFTWFIDELHQREERGGDWKVYHYNTYELTSMRRIAKAWPNEIERADLVDDVERLIKERFDDLYRRIDVGLRTRDGSTSLKIVEKLAGYDRMAESAAVARADDSIKAYEAFIASDDDDQRAEILEGIRQYNVHDVRATKAVHHWLREITVAPDWHRVQPALDADVTEARDMTGRTVTFLVENKDEYQPSADVVARVELTSELRTQLLEAAEAAESEDSSGVDDHAGSAMLASGLSAVGARLLAEMLEWHRRESIVGFLDSVRLQEWALGEGIAGDGGPDPAGSVFTDLNGGADVDTTRIAPGTEHESCLLDIVGPIASYPPKPGKRAGLHEYKCRPGAWKVKAGSTVKEAALLGATGATSVKLESHDAQTGIFSFRRVDAPRDLGPMVIAPFFDPPTVWEMLISIAREALAGDPGQWARVAFDALDQHPPLSASAMAARDGEAADERARRIVAAMDTGLLPVQGPPGTGKTHLGCELIMDQLSAGGRGGAPAVIAVTANSHKVMDNLLNSVVRRAQRDGVRVRIAHLGSADKVDTAGGIELIDGGSGKLADWILAAKDGGDALVVAATKFGWTRPDLTGVADLLIIDEAGQLPLADAVAVCSASQRVVALGDPQQLAAPIQAAHDDSVQVSLLEHVAAGRAVLPPEVGVFLDVTYRMHPAVCRVVADLAYDGELVSSTQAAARNIDGTDVEVAGQVVAVDPGVAWLPVEGGSDAEVAAVVDLLAGLVGAAHVTDEHGTSVLQGSDILVVAPHNAHVNRLDARLSTLGVRTGTVDKFQGQQAHIVIYSMGRVASSAGDIPFLYELNRVNVALSRARLMAIVVSDPAAVLPPVRTPDQLMMASRFTNAVAGR